MFSIIRKKTTRNMKYDLKHFDFAVFFIIYAVLYVLSIKYDLMERIYVFSRQHEYLELDELFTTLIFFSFILGFYYIRRIKDLKKAKKETEKANSNLQTALSEIKQLEGFITICSVCKKVKLSNNSWEQLEKYISDNTDAEFSHGICMDCVKKVYPEYSEDL